MAAQDNLGPQWYHGTSAELNPNDLVEPGRPKKHVMTQGESGDYVYAANQKSVAGFFGHNVYKVEPTGTTEPDPEDVWSQGMIRSQHPLKVLGKA